MPQMSGKEILMHYQSQYYDPQKAHEYYVRNRQLKGRPSGIKETKAQRAARLQTSQRQKEALGYAQKQIGGARKAEQVNNAKAFQLRQAALRKQAKETEARIVQKLSAAVENLRKQMADPNVSSRINKIPDDASPAVREFLEKQNARIRATAKKEALAKNAKISDQVSMTRQAARGELQKLGTSIKSAIQQARTTLNTSKKATDAKYKKIADREKQNIRTKVR